MTDAQPSNLNPTNIALWTGLAALYDSCRPTTPAVLLTLLPAVAGVLRPALVVDLASGTGLSTRPWAAYAERVVGIEPNADMREYASQRAAELTNLSFQEGTSVATGLPDQCADILTVTQALHWMEPEPTFAEIGRVLRPGGIFAALDYEWTPILNWRAAQAYQEVAKRLWELRSQLEPDPGVHAWPKDQHLPHMRESGQFRYVREFAVHSAELGNAERLVNLAVSNSAGNVLRKGLASEDEAGVPRLRQVARETLGDAPSPWYFTFVVRMGVK